MADDAPLFEEALELAGLDATDFRFDPAVVATWGGDRWRTPMFDLFFTDPWKCSPYGREHAKAIAQAAGSLHDLQYLAQSNTGIRVRDNYYGSFLSEAQEAVAADGGVTVTISGAQVTQRSPNLLRASPPCLPHASCPLRRPSGVACVAHSASALRCPSAST